MLSVQLGWVFLSGFKSGGLWNLYLAMTKSCCYSHGLNLFPDKVFVLSQLSRGSHSNCSRQQKGPEMLEVSDLIEISIRQWNMVPATFYFTQKTWVGSENPFPVIPVAISIYGKFLSLHTLPASKPCLICWKETLTLEYWNDYASKRTMYRAGVRVWTNTINFHEILAAAMS